MKKPTVKYAVFYHHAFLKDHGVAKKQVIKESQKM